MFPGDRPLGALRGLLLILLFGVALALLCTAPLLLSPGPRSHSVEVAR